MPGAENGRMSEEDEWQGVVVAVVGREKEMKGREDGGPGSPGTLLSHWGPLLAAKTGEAFVVNPVDTLRRHTLVVHS